MGVQHETTAAIVSGKNNLCSSRVPFIALVFFFFSSIKNFYELLNQSNKYNYFKINAAIRALSFLFPDVIAFYISNLIKRLYWRLLIVRVEKEMNYLWFIIFPILARGLQMRANILIHIRVMEKSKNCKNERKKSSHRCLLAEFKYHFNWHLSLIYYGLNKT